MVAKEKKIGGWVKQIRNYKLSVIKEISHGDVMHTIGTIAIILLYNNIDDSNKFYFSLSSLG